LDKQEVFEIMVNRIRNLQSEKEIPDNALIPPNVMYAYKYIPYQVLIRPLVLMDRDAGKSLQTLANRYRVTLDQIRFITRNYGENRHTTK